MPLPPPSPFGHPRPLATELAPHCRERERHRRRRAGPRPPHRVSRGTLRVRGGGAAGRCTAARGGRCQRRRVCHASVSSSCRAGCGVPTRGVGWVSWRHGRGGGRRRRVLRRQRAGGGRPPSRPRAAPQPRARTALAPVLFPPRRRRRLRHSSRACDRSSGSDPWRWGHAVPGARGAEQRAERRRRLLRAQDDTRLGRARARRLLVHALQPDAYVLGAAAVRAAAGRLADAAARHAAGSSPAARWRMGLRAQRHAARWLMPCSFAPSLYSCAWGKRLRGRLHVRTQCQDVLVQEQLLACCKFAALYCGPPRGGGWRTLV